MKIKLLSFFIMLLVGLAIVNADFSIVNQEVRITIDQGSIEDVELDITNNGPNDVDFTFDISQLDLKDNDGDEIKLSFLNADGVVAGETREVTIRLNADDGLDFEDYGGIVTVSDGTDTHDFNLLIDVIPIVCDFGVVGNELTLKINDPDVNDDIKPGEIIKVDTEVRNNGNNDIDVQVTGFLFSDNRRVESASSETQNVNDNDEEDIDFDIEVPVDNEDLSENDDIFLVIKAFDDDGEDENCVQETVKLKMDLDNDDINIMDSSRFAPNVVACGQATSAIVNVVNIGKDEQDVRVEVKNSALGISQRSAEIELEEFDSKDDNEASFKIPINIPKDVKPGVYNFAVTAKGDSTASDSLSLTVNACESFKEEVTFQRGAKLTLLQESLTVSPGEERTLGVRLTNEEPGPVLYNIELVNTGDFSDGDSSKTVTVPAEQTMTVFLPFNVREEVLPGRYSATVNLRNPIGHLSSNTVVFDVSNAIIAPKSAGSDSGVMSIVITTLYIILALVALFLIAVLIKVLSKR